MASSLQERLRQDLVGALSERRKIEVSMIRTLISALENAEAPEAEQSAEPKVGFGHDQPRRELRPEEAKRILEDERSELVDAASRYRELGVMAEAEELELRTSIVERYLDERS